MKCSKYNVSYEVVFIVMIIVCLRSFFALLVMIRVNERNIGIALFNSTLIIEARLVKESVCTFPLLRIFLIVNPSKMEIFLFASSKYFFILSSLASKLPLNVLSTNLESLHTNTFLTCRSCNYFNATKKALYSVTLLVDKKVNHVHGSIIPPKGDYNYPQSRTFNVTSPIHKHCP